MKSMLEPMRRHPLATYLLLTFVLTFGSVIILAGGVPGPDTPDTGLSLAIIAMLVGPAVAGPVMIALVHGRTGMQALGARMRRWRVPVRWYAAALLAVPATMLTSLLVLTAFSREFVPDAHECQLPRVLADGHTWRGHDARRETRAPIATPIASTVTEPSDG
jgi:uncharacterized protein